MKKFKILRESDSCCRREGEYYNSKLNPRDRRVAEGIAVTDYTNDKLRVGNDEFVYFYVCKDDGSFCDASGKPFKSDDDARKYVACLCDYDASEVAHELNKILGNVYQWDMFRRPNKITENKNYNTMKRYIIKKRQSANESESMRSRMHRVVRNGLNENMNQDEIKEILRNVYLDDEHNVKGVPQYPRRLEELSDELSRAKKDYNDTKKRIDKEYDDYYRWYMEELHDYAVDKYGLNIDFENFCVEWEEFTKTDGLKMWTAEQNRKMREEGGRDSHQDYGYGGY